jgi:vacuolar-type H+-ATPase subunit E/Vma4
MLNKPRQIEQKKEEVQKEAQKQVDTLQGQIKQEAEKKLKDLFKKRP